jgi:high-affinity iron transporter
MLVQTAVILFREGLEASLIVAALAALLRRSHASAQLAALYLGVATAVVASVAFGWTLQFAGALTPGGIIGGAATLTIATLMYYVSGWLLIGRWAGAWGTFLQKRANQALINRSDLAIATLSFIAIFREGAEAALFLNVLGWRAGQNFEVLAGLLYGAAALAGVFWGLQFVSRRLALRSVFFITSAFLFFTATGLFGEAVGEFQAAHVLPATPIEGAVWAADLGLNWTWEAIALQMMALATSATAFVAFVVEKRRSGFNNAQVNQ